MLLAPATANPNVAPLFIELGAIILVLALLARVALRFGFSPIPLYLLVGLALGEGGLIALDFTEEFISVGAEIGVILLLFMLGLEYTGDELTHSLRTSLPSGVVDLISSFTPGFVTGLLLGWDWRAAILLGGVTYISSSGVIAKVLSDSEWMGNRETPLVLSILVLEDLAMAVYLPLVGVILIGGGLLTGLISLGTALVTVVIVLLLAVRFGDQLSALIDSNSDEVILLTVFGLILLVAGVAQGLEVSAAVGAFLVGIGLSGPVAEHARELLTPLRDLFAATFFLFFSLQIDPMAIPPVLGVALLLAVVSAGTKMATGYWTAAKAGVGLRGRWRAATLLVARGEFSIVIAGLGAAAGFEEPGLLPLAAAYVLIMAVAGPVLVKVSDPLVENVLKRRREREREERENIPQTTQPVAEGEPAADR